MEQLEVESVLFGLEKFDLVPIFSRAIIKKTGTPKEIGRIIIPENSREMEPTEGVVVAVGDDCSKVSVGDKVYYGRYSGFEFDRNGIKYVFCNEEDILAIIK